jgi:hypothetical protein
MKVKPKRSGGAIEDPSSVVVDGRRLCARASIPLQDADVVKATVGLVLRLDK